MKHRTIRTGRYQLKRLIASTNSSDVYEAWDGGSHTAVAIKLLHPKEVQPYNTTERFLEEIQANNAIKHPSILRITDAGEEGARLFYVMELLEGETLCGLKKSKRLSVRDIVSITQKILEPLSMAHRMGITHRDIKPSNIFISSDEEGRYGVKLLDFGIASLPWKRCSDESTTVGTPGYMSPEQAQHPAEVGPRSDVWSVGVLLYELLTGQHPFQGPTPRAICINTIIKPHLPIDRLAPGVPQPLIELVDRCLSKSQENRPADAGEMLAQLTGLALCQPIPKATQREKTHRQARNKPSRAAKRASTDSKHPSYRLSTPKEMQQDARSKGVIKPYARWVGGSMLIIALLLALGTVLSGIHDLLPTESKGHASIHALMSPSMARTKAFDSVDHDGVDLFEDEGDRLETNANKAIGQASLLIEEAVLVGPLMGATKAAAPKHKKRCPLKNRKPISSQTQSPAKNAGVRVSGWPTAQTPPFPRTSLLDRP